MNQAEFDREITEREARRLALLHKLRAPCRCEAFRFPHRPGSSDECERDKYGDLRPPPPAEALSEEWRLDYAQRARDLRG